MNFSPLAVFAVARLNALTTKTPSGKQFFFWRSILLPFGDKDAECIVKGVDMEFSKRLRHAEKESSLENSPVRSFSASNIAPGTMRRLLLCGR
jgi:hypothetical protein